MVTMECCRIFLHVLHVKRRTLVLLVFWLIVAVSFLWCNSSRPVSWAVSWRNLTSSANNFHHLKEPLPLIDMGTYKLFEKTDSFGNVISYNASRAVLLFSEHPQSVVLRKIKILLEAHRILYEVIIWNKIKDNQLVIPRLIEVKNRVRYSAFIFANGDMYAEMDVWNKQILEDFCLRFGVGIAVLFNIEGLDQPGEINQFPNLPLWTKAGITDLYRLELNPSSSLFEITRADSIYEGDLKKRDHVIFYSNDSSFVPVAFSYRKDKKDPVLQSDPMHTETYLDSDVKKYITIMHDTGKFDGIQKVFWGSPPVDFWLYRLIFLDALSKLSRGLLGMPLERYIQIDIDDIFVAESGTRMKKDDVLELVESQKRIATFIPGFHYNLGFSGYYYLNGTPDEDEGDREIIKHANQFWWFCHTYRHAQAHKFDSTHQVKEQMKRNKDFAKMHNIPVNPTYSVSPHHSGVYPVHEQLYDAWKSVWGVQVTSTEEYPHLHPSWHRRGFIFNNIMVLPRQTCGLFTKTLHFASYPGGRRKLEKSIFGGELFSTFVDNPISIFMTHFGNYGSDRLAVYTFENVIKFIRQWTNLKLISIPPLELGKKYFEIFENDKLPIWSNPCNDSRHVKIWSLSKSCDRLPTFLIVGPQKSGTTALYTFLSMHPQLKGNHRSVTSYEEVQFFSKDNYLKGIDWYMNFFPEKSNTENLMYFEKSANYFDSLKAPERASALLPRAKIIVILLEPGRRAYSWYQHARSKGDFIATEHSFYELLAGQNKTDSPHFDLLRSRCLRPGEYAENLERWLLYYPAEQILLLDGETLRENPAKSLGEVQAFLGLKEFNFKSRLKFDLHKGFFCPVNESGTVNCLGRSKGRQYKKMDKASRQYLNEYYRLRNMWLLGMLEDMKKQPPLWLKRELKKTQLH